MEVYNNIGHNCPEALLNAARSSNYRPLTNTMRVSELIDSPLIRQLRMKHWDKLRKPVTSCIASLSGTAWHSAMEKHAPDYGHIEQRFFRYFPKKDILLTGMPDYYDGATKTLFDYKQFKIWKYIKKDFAEWERQQNVYKALIKSAGLEVEKIVIYGQLKDFSRLKALAGGDYPPHESVAIQLRVWSDEEAEEYISQRLQLHTNPEEYICTPEERWTEETTYALMKDGRKSAVRVMSDHAELNAYAVDKKIDFLDGKHKIVERTGCDKRCDAWCECKPFCPLFKGTTDGTSTTEGPDAVPMEGTDILATEG